MKKSIVLLLFTVIIMSSCQKNDMITSPPTNNIPGFEDINNGNTLVNEVPLNHTSYLYNTYDNLLNDLTNKTINSKSNQVVSELSNYGVVYKATVSAFMSNRIKIYVPKSDNQVMQLRNRVGYSNITLLTNDLYNLPWIWYHCVDGEYDLDVKIAYPSVLNNNEIRDDQSYLEILSIIAPDAPSPDNFYQYESYKSVFEKEISLADGKTVKALVYEYHNDNKIYIMYHDNGILVSLYADSKLFSDRFFKSFQIYEYVN